MTLVARHAAEPTRGPAAPLMTDQARFEQIYDSYSGLILAYAVRRTHDIDDAVDVVAETFTVAWRRIADVPADDEARPWLYGVARRVLANQHRTVRRRTRLDDKLRLAVTVVSLDPVGNTVVDEVTQAALACLSDQDRELLTLSAWDGLNSGEVGVAVGCSSGTARVRLHRARRRFEQHLEDGRNR